MPEWAKGAVRPFLCGHAYHLGGFASFNQLGHFDRLTLARRIFGSRLVEEEIGRVCAVLTGWGYQYGREHDLGVPSVMSQLFLLNRTPRARDLATLISGASPPTRGCSARPGPVRLPVPVLPSDAGPALLPQAFPPTHALGVHSHHPCNLRCRTSMLEPLDRPHTTGLGQLGPR